MSSIDLAEDRSYRLVAVSAIFIILTTIVLGLRFYAKRFQERGFFSDDALLLAAYIINCGMCAIGIIMTKVGGVGRHVVFLEKNSPGAVVGWAKCLFAFEVIYFISVALPKLSILCLYLRIFNWRGTVRNLAWVLFSLTATTSLALVIAACFQCQPLPYWWDRFSANPTPGGKCFDVQMFFHAQALPGFILDLGIMALPTGTIWHLNLPTIKRVALFGIFLVASFGIVASIVRATVFFKESAFEDPTMASVELVGWSIIETSVYIITGCLPHLKPLASRYTPDWVKRALKHSILSMSSGVKSKVMTTGRAGKHSYAMSRMGGSSKPPTDDSVELTRRDNGWGDGHMTTHIDGGASIHSSQSALSPRSAASAEYVRDEFRGKGDSKRSGRVSPPGQIMVTREVKLVRE